VHADAVEPGDVTDEREVTVEAGRIGPCNLIGARGNGGAARNLVCGAVQGSGAVLEGVAQALLAEVERALGVVGREGGTDEFKVEHRGDGLLTFLNVYSEKTVEV